MPLPMMAGDPATMMSQPGMAPPASPAVAPPSPGVPQPGGAQDQGPIDPRQQIRGMVEMLSQGKTAWFSVLEAVARQFPGAAKEANQVVMMNDQALKALMEKVLLSLQMPEPEAPAVLF